MCAPSLAQSLSHLGQLQSLCGVDALGSDAVVLLLADPKGEVTGIAFIDSTPIKCVIPAVPMPTEWSKDW